MLRPLEKIPGSFVTEPVIHPDERGSFTEWFKASEFEEAVGHPFIVEQANVSVSKAGVLRGLHFADVPPGQGKWVTCASGSVIDVIADIRVGSPTFGQWTSVELSGDNRKSVYLPVGVAHGFAAKTCATVVYLTTAAYNPHGEHELNLFDETLAIDWNVESPVISDKDKVAPSLKDLEAAGKLPSYEQCLAFEEDLANQWAIAYGDTGE